MDLLKVGNIVGNLEGLISRIEVGTLVTKKNSTNATIRNKALKLLEELNETLTVKV